MDNILDFIKSTKRILNDTLDLFNSLESDMTSNSLDLKVKERKLNEAKSKFTLIESFISDFKKIPAKLKNKEDKLTKNKENSVELDMHSYIKDILFDIVDKIVESHTVVEVKSENGEEKETMNIENAFTAVKPEEEIPKSGDVKYDLRVVLNDISEYTISDLQMNHKLNDNLPELTESTEPLNNEENLITDDLLILNYAAKEAILKDSDTESIVECESYKETSPIINECSVVLFDICQLNPDIDINDIQDLRKLEKEVKRLCCIPKPKTVKPIKKNEPPRIDRARLNHSRQLSKIYESDSDASSEFSETKSGNSGFEIKINNMSEPLLSSTDSDTSLESEKTKTVFYNGKKQLSNDKSSKPKTRSSLTIPKLENSDSESNAKSNKSAKTKSGSKRKPIYCSSSASEGESDASLSDLYKKITPKKKYPSKSRDIKPKISKKVKLEKSQGKVKEEPIKDEEEEVETRKNIHKIITNSKLSKATKTAAQLESERRKRIEERQKEYNKDVSDQNQLAVPCDESLILEKDADGNPVVEVDQMIVKNLKPHQIDAVNFLWDCVIENVECLRKSRETDSEEDKKISAVGGCVLAHCMGLGKTLSLIAFMHTMLTTECLDVRTCLVICPVNTALNWKKEWEMWMPEDKPINVFEVCSTECKKSKAQVVQDWYAKGGVLIIGYQMYRLLATGDSRTVRRKILKQKLNEVLVNPGPDFVVCDEGHLLKNDKSAINKVITKIHTRRRIVLTGTPLQNKLLEYHTMVQFVKPNLLGTQKEFLNRFVNPIHNGQHINSTPYDVNLMKKRSHILFKMLDGCVHRRDYSALVKYLPPKYEYVIKIRLSDIQEKLYRQYLSVCRENKHSLFQDHLTFSRIWTHPFVICMHQEIMDKKMFFVDTDEEYNDSFINDGSDNESKDNDEKQISKPSPNNNSVINLISDESDTEVVPKKKSKNQDKASSGSESSVDEVVRTWSTLSRSVKRNELVESDDEPELTGIKEYKEIATLDKHWWSDIITPENEHQIEISGKLAVLFQILRKSGDIGDKIIIFSQSLLVLDIIEKYLQELHTIAEKVQEDLKKLNESIEKSPSGSNEDPNKSNVFFSDIGYNSWVKGLDYDRMDGTTQAFVRADIQSRFNDDDERRLRLFLISTRAGGMGINLVSANRVVIFDVSWNPSHDIQAIFRSYRFGQNKPVYVYRLVSQGTMEEKIYERQVTKQSLSLRVVDEQQISRYFTEEDLKSLYKFEPDIYDSEKVRETPILPKDRFLAELIQELPQYIHGYHEHDSLLQNKTDEELTESERQEAWKEFEEEKIRGTRSYPIANSQIQPKQIQDPGRMQQLQIGMMLQQYPQYATLYAQNYNNLVKYILSRKPDLNPIQLNHEVQQLFIQSLQKYYNIQVESHNNQQAQPAAGSSQSMQ